MKPKERILAALNHEEADRVPTGDNQLDGRLVEEIFGVPHLCNMGWKEKNALWDGKRDEIVADYIKYHVAIPRKLEWDYVRVPMVPADKPHPRPKMTGEFAWLDEEGFEVHFNPDAGNIAVRGEFPDLLIDDLPDSDEEYEVDTSELDAIAGVAKEIGDTHFIIARLSTDGTFPWRQTVGMNEFLVRMITDPDFVERAVQVYVNRSLAYIEAAFDVGAHAVMPLDDYCDNAGPIMGAERFRRFILPGIVRQCEAAHKRGGIFIKHTDGNTWDILDDLVDIGIDGWHGIQPGIGMDLKLLKQRYGNKLCLFGGVDCDTLVAGTPEAIRGEVAYAIRHAGPGGGLVLTTSNVVQAGITLNNYQALRKAVREFGSYPITLE